MAAGGGRHVAASGGTANGGVVLDMMGGERGEARSEGSRR